MAAEQAGVGGTGTDKKCAVDVCEDHVTGLQAVRYIYRVHDALIIPGPERESVSGVLVVLVNPSPQQTKVVSAIEGGVQIRFFFKAQALVFLWDLFLGKNQ